MENVNTPITIIRQEPLNRVPVIIGDASWVQETGLVAWAAWVIDADGNHHNKIGSFGYAKSSIEAEFIALNSAIEYAFESSIASPGSEIVLISDCTAVIECIVQKQVSRKIENKVLPKLVQFLALQEKYDFTFKIYHPKWNRSRPYRLYYHWCDNTAHKKISGIRSGLPKSVNHSPVLNLVIASVYVTYHDYRVTTWCSQAIRDKDCILTKSGISSYRASQKTESEIDGVLSAIETISAFDLLTDNTSIRIITDRNDYCTRFFNHEVDVTKIYPNLYQRFQDLVFRYNLIILVGHWKNHPDRFLQCKGQAMHLKRHLLGEQP